MTRHCCLLWMILALVAASMSACATNDEVTASQTSTPPGLPSPRREGTVPVTAPPSRGEGPGVDLPLPAGAQQTLEAGAMAFYEIRGTTVESLVAFFTERMASLGFTLSEDDSILSEGFASVTFVSPGESAHITLTAEGDVVHMIVELEQRDGI